MKVEKNIKDEKYEITITGWFYQVHNFQFFFLSFSLDQDL